MPNEFQLLLPLSRSVLKKEAKQHLTVASSVQTGKVVQEEWRLHGDLYRISFQNELTPLSSLQQCKGSETLYLGKQMNLAFLSIFKKTC